MACSSTKSDIFGTDISWMEMSKVGSFPSPAVHDVLTVVENKLIPTLFSRFDLHLTDPEAIWKEQCK